VTADTTFRIPEVGEIPLLRNSSHFAEELATFDLVIVEQLCSRFKRTQ
jgi:hypothetical protein